MSVAERRKVWCISLLAIIACGARSQLDVGLDADTDARGDSSLRDTLSDEASEAPTETDAIDAPAVECALDAGLFTCGDGSCDRREELCWEIVGGPSPGVDILSCKPLKPGCCACACATFDPKTCFCTDDAAGVHVTCPVP
jgi:hypothetical protein